MVSLRVAAARVAALFRRKRSERDFEDELAFHLERETERLRAGGVSTDEARYAARRRFGAIDKTKEIYRDTLGIPLIETFFQDLRYAARVLRRSPGFSAVAALSLALGIGANTAIFSLFNAVLLRQMPVAEPERLMILGAAQPNGPDAPLTRQQAERLFTTPVLAGGFVQVRAQIPLTLQLGAIEDDVSATVVSGGFHSVLGLRPAAGRLLAPSDDQSGAPPVAVISDRYWQRRFGRDAGAIGSTFTVNGAVFTIVGVTPPEFYGTSSGWDPDLTLPFAAGSTASPIPPGALPSGAIARLAPGVSRERATAEAGGILLALVATENNQRNRPAGLALTPGGAGFEYTPATQFGKPLQILMVVVGLLLLLACANLASLLVARAVARQREVAVRSAIGASRSRLVRQFLTESLLLTLVGSTIGVTLARWLSGELIAAMSGATPLVLRLTPDWRVLAFTGVAMLATCLLMGLAPALRAASLELGSSLKQVRPRGRLSTGRALVTVQVGISMLLVVGATLFISTLVRLYSVDQGFQAAHVLTFRVSSRQVDPARILERLTSLPGVSSAGAAASLPFGSITSFVSVDVDGERRSLPSVSVTPGYFATQGVPLRAGRLFDSSDGAKTAIVSESLARRYFNGAALGRRLNDAEVIGVVGNVRIMNLRSEPAPVIYVPLPATTAPFAALLGRPSLNYVTRVEQGDPMRMAPAIEAALRELDANLRLRAVATEAELIDRTLVNERMLAVLAGFFGAVALLLAGIGVYGVLSFHVTQRTNEFGVRMAMGAARADIRRLVLRDVGVVLGVGMAIGAAGAAGLARLAEAMLFGLTPTDPGAYGVAAATLAGAVLLGAWLPTLRAARLDPMVALRHE